LFLVEIGPCPDFAKGSGAWAELELAAKSQKYLLENGFRETGNVDFVRRILLEGTGLDPEQFLRIREVRNTEDFSFILSCPNDVILPTLSDQSND